MDNEIKTWLFDILQSVTEVESYFEGRPKIFEEYIKDIKTKRAEQGKKDKTAAQEGEC